MPRRDPPRFAVWRHGSHRLLLQLLASRDSVAADEARQELQISSGFVLRMLEQLEALQFVHHHQGRYSLRPKGRKFIEERSLANGTATPTV